MTANPLLTWPPELTEVQVAALTLQATTYALSHGLVYLPVADKQPPAPTSTIHAPLALLPSPIPRRQFDKARGLQKIYNILYSRVATDVEFLDRVMGAVEGVGKVDEFTGSLWKRWIRVREAGIVQPLQLGLFRSDYMVHLPDVNKPASLKQVEFNTISSSFGTLSERVSGLHRYLLKSTGYYGSSQYLKTENLPENHTTAGLAEGLVAAHKAYGVPSARILFVVQDNERNVFDQRWLEYELLETHSIHVVRQTLTELLTSASVDTTSHVLRINGDIEISTVYLRAGYMPTDYLTPKHYDLRYLFETSKAIQCPSIQLQLAGGKKVQEELTKTGVLEKFLHDFPALEISALKESWMEMWALNEDGDAGVTRAREESSTLVLKPQREGGGNNVYKEAIPPFLDDLPPSEREAWIAMKLIATPQGLGNYLVRAGGGHEGAVKTEVISELGIFSWSLFGNGDDGVCKIEEKEVGWLVRTKGKDSNEGGVAAGFSVLDSIVLVD
ncbi:glutathione synthase [Irpex rosettiformis]|uniref:Glutathione synthase n=1 Tax=Irpex rosettiformis TaxID=378272 RepID=A0ACB8U2V2_9APHY|nr:glutathione synthase [Irpex rosettiformis]